MRTRVILDLLRFLRNQKTSQRDVSIYVCVRKLLQHTFTAKQLLRGFIQSTRVFYFSKCRVIACHGLHNESNYSRILIGLS